MGSYSPATGAWAAQLIHYTHETTVGGVQGLWYRGTWSAAGQWVDDGTTSLIWQHESVTYQLTGQG